MSCISHFWPSGSGQDSIIEKLAESLPIERVITMTTRPARPGESNGHPYHFVTRDVFEEKCKQKAFLEYARHYGGEYYGVTQEEVERVRHSGKVGIWKVDWQGVRNIKALFPDMPAILITAPASVLEARLRRRDPERSEASLAERMAYSREYEAHHDLYDFVVENEDGHLDEAVSRVSAILVEYLKKVSA
ncbi:MAG: guanylate kinase [Candidatus Moraniibacteriota bacterium]|nr:MAG: guanylate kinase [Candidatus Moranbacteria bacterium]